MKELINSHFDILIVASIATLLLIAYVILLINGIDNKAIELTMVGAVSGAIGMGTKKTSGAMTVEGDVNVADDNKKRV